MILAPEHFTLLASLGSRVGVTSGCFDLLHFYHLRYLERCREQCGFLVVGVDSDRLVRRHKNKDPIVSEHERAAMVAALRCVDAVWIMRELEEFHRISRAASVVFKHSAVIYGNPITPPEGIELVIIPDIDALTSTSAIVRRAKAAEMP